MAKHWDDLIGFKHARPIAANPDLTTPGPWFSRTLGAVAGVALGICALLWIAPRLAAPYQPFDGIVGPPAFHDRSPRPELWLYLLGMAVCGSAGLLGWLAARGGIRRGVASAVVLAATASCALYARRSGRLPDSEALSLLRNLLSEPLALAQLGCFSLAAWWLSLPGPISEHLAPAPRGGPIEKLPPVRVALETACRFLPPYLLLTVLLGATMPNSLAGLVLAFPFALAAEVALRPAFIPRRARHPSQTIERAAWIVVALAPGGLWLTRYLRTLDIAVSSGLLLAVALLLAATPPAIGWWRRRSGWAPGIDPLFLLPWMLMWTLLLGGGESDHYDAFHQGESTYPYQALSHGLLPWRDIFYVHGLGVDTVGGWFMRDPQLRTHALDGAYHVFVGAAAAWLALTFYLRAWGRAWWLAALMTAALTAAGAAPYGRYLPVWIVLIFLHGFLSDRKLRRLAMTGMVAALSPFYSLDVGSALVIATGLWVVLWGIAFGGRQVSFQVTMGRSYPLAAYLVGLSIVAVPILVLLLAMGLLRSAWDLHVQYLLVKHHYDKIPLALGYVGLLTAPAAGLLGLWAAWGIVRRRQEGPLAGLILFLTILDILTFMRALDRSDPGHVAYATMIAWPLLGTLVVWQFRRGHEPGIVDPAKPTEAELRRLDPGAFARASVLGGLLIVFPYMHNLIRGPVNAPASIFAEPLHGAMTDPPLNYAFYFGANAHRPLMGPVADPPSRAFFDVADQVLRIVRAPGPGSDVTSRVFYDFSNQPAIYTWTGLTAPTRFFTAYYASSMTWQREVVADLRTRQVQWVLWRGPSPDWNHPDGMPNWLRQHAISRHLLANYRPEKHLSVEGPPLLIDGAPVEGFSEFDSLLLAPASRPGPSATELPFAPLWLERAELGEIPAVWGRGGAVPEIPRQPLARVERPLPAGGSVDLPIDRPNLLVRAQELGVEFGLPVEGRCVVAWENVNGDRRARSIAFNVHAGFTGPYRLPVASMPSWVWGGAPVRITIQIDSTDPVDTRVLLEAKE